MREIECILAEQGSFGAVVDVFPRKQSSPMQTDVTWNKDARRSIRAFTTGAVPKGQILVVEVPDEE